MQPLARSICPALLTAAIALGVSVTASAGDALPEAPANDAPAGGGDAPAQGLSGKDIYRKVLENRFRSTRQTGRLISGDRAGSTSEAAMTVLWKTFRDDAGKSVEGVFSKTVIRYTEPPDLRHTAYLIFNNDGEPDDQFIYLNSNRRVRRLNLRGEAMMGSDFGIEDVVPREIEDATYARFPDEVFEGRDCYVVEIEPVASARSEYSRLRSWIDKERPVVLHTKYWDQDRVASKEADAPFAEVREIDGVWVPMRAEMKNLVTEGWSRIVIDSFDANPELKPGEFSKKRLMSH